MYYIHTYIYVYVYVGNIHFNFSQVWLSVLLCLARVFPPPWAQGTARPVQVGLEQFSPGFGAARGNLCGWGAPKDVEGHTAPCRTCGGGNPKLTNHGTSGTLCQSNLAIAHPHPYFLAHRKTPGGFQALGKLPKFLSPQAFGQVFGLKIRYLQ